MGLFYSLKEWDMEKTESEILEFIYKSGTLSYDDICFHLRPRIIYDERKKDYIANSSKEQLLEYRAETRKATEDAANHILDGLLKEGAIKGNRGGYKITDTGIHYFGFWKEHKDYWCELMRQTEDMEATNWSSEDENYTQDWDDARDWEEDKENHELMAKLFDIENMVRSEWPKT